MLIEIARKTILGIGRTLAFLHDMDELDRVGNYNGGSFPRTAGVTEQEANLVSSEMEDGNHAPALDIDFPCYTLPSSTPGHAHLYFDKPLSWKDYKKLLTTLYEIGYIEEGFYRAAIRTKATYLRLPGILKVKHQQEVDLVF